MAILDLSTLGLIPGADNAPAIDAAIAGLSAAGPNTILVNDIFTVASALHITSKQNLTITGTGTFLRPYAGNTYMILMHSCPDMLWEGITFDGAETHLSRGFYVRDCQRIHVDAVTWENMGDETNYSSLAATSFGGSSDIVIENCICRNIKAAPLSINPATGKSDWGVCSGINVGGFYGGQWCQNIQIDNCTVEDIYPVKDGDGVKCLQLDIAPVTGVHGEKWVRSAPDTYLYVTDCTFRRCSKRAIKTQGWHMYSSGNKIYDSEVVPLDFQHGRYCESVNDEIYFDLAQEKPPWTLVIPAIGGVARGLKAVINGSDDYLPGYTTPSGHPTSLTVGVRVSSDGLSAYYWDDFRLVEGLINPGWVVDTFEPQHGQEALVQEVDIRGVRTPVSVGIDTLERLEVSDSTFIDNKAPTTIISGNYASGGRSYYPTIGEVTFTGNNIANEVGYPYEGFIHYHLSSEYHDYQANPADRYWEYLEAVNDRENLRIVTGNTSVENIYDYHEYRVNLTIADNTGTRFEILNEIGYSEGILNPMDTVDAVDDIFLTSLSGDICYNTNPDVTGWKCVLDYSVGDPKGVWTTLLALRQSVFDSILNQIDHIGATRRDLRQILEGRQALWGMIKASGDDSYISRVGGPPATELDTILNNAVYGLGTIAEWWIVHDVYFQFADVGLITSLEEACATFRKRAPQDWHEWHKDVTGRYFVPDNVVYTFAREDLLLGTFERKSDPAVDDIFTPGSQIDLESSGPSVVIAKSELGTSDTAWEITAILVREDGTTHDAVATIPADSDRNDYVILGEYPLTMNALATNSIFIADFLDFGDGVHALLMDDNGQEIVKIQYVGPGPDMILEERTLGNYYVADNARIYPLYIAVSDVTTSGALGEGDYQCSFYPLPDRDYEVNAETDPVSYAETIETYMDGWLDGRLEVAPAGNYLERFSVFTPDFVTPLNGVFTQNLNFWASDIDLSGVSPWCDWAAGSWIAGTAISPRHLVTARHFADPPIGTKFIFVQKNGDLVERTLIGLANADTYDSFRPYTPDSQDYPGPGGWPYWGIIHPDFKILYLDEDLPPSIKFYPILRPQDWFGDMDNFYIIPPNPYFDVFGRPLLVVDYVNATGNMRALVGDWLSLDFYDWRDYLYNPTRHWTTAMGEIDINLGTGIRANYTDILAGGDSGHPSFLLFREEPVFIETHHFGGGGAKMGQGPWITFAAEHVNQLMLDLDVDNTGYQLTYFDMDAFIEQWIKNRD